MKTVIGLNTLGKEAYEREYSERYKAFTELKDFVQSHSKEEINAQTLYNSPKGYFMQLMKEQHGSEFPSSLKLEKVLDLLEIPVHKLDALIEAFNGNDVELNVDSSEPIEKDWNIYAENKKQADMFKLLSHFCDVVNKLSKTEMNLQYGNFIHGTSNAVSYNFNSQSLHPRYSYIQQIK